MDWIKIIVLWNDVWQFSSVPNTFVLPMACRLAWISFFRQNCCEAVDLINILCFKCLSFSCDLWGTPPVHLLRLMGRNLVGWTRQFWKPVLMTRPDCHILLLALGGGGNLFHRCGSLSWLWVCIRKRNHLHQWFDIRNFVLKSAVWEQRKRVCHGVIGCKFGQVVMIPRQWN